MNRALLAALIVLASSGAARGQDSTTATPSPRTLRGVFERSVLEVQPSGPALVRIDVDNRLGDVRVEGHDEDKLVVAAVKRAHDDSTLDRLKVTVLSEPNGFIHVSTRIAEGQNARPIPKGSVRIDLVIQAPRGARVHAQVWNDRLEVSGMDNGAELTANDGDIAVMNVAGAVETQSSSGKQNFVDVFGAVDAQAVTGNLELVTVRGKRLDASVHRGNIQARQIRVKELSLRTTIGDIHVQGFALAGGRYRIASYRGNIEVELGHSSALSVSARSGGRVTLPGKLTAHSDDGDAIVGILPATVPAQKNAATAYLELRSRVGNLQLAVVPE